VKVKVVVARRVNTADMPGNLSGHWELCKEVVVHVSRLLHTVTMFTELNAYRVSQIHATEEGMEYVYGVYAKAPSGHPIKEYGIRFIVEEVI